MSDIIERLRNRVHDSPMPAEHLMDEAADEIEQLRAGWQPIETAPKDDSEGILATDGKWIAQVYWGGFDWRISHYAVCQEYDWTPTHWQPLPAPPVESKSEVVG